MAKVKTHAEHVATLRTTHVAAATKRAVTRDKDIAKVLADFEKKYKEPVLTTLASGGLTARGIKGVSIGWQAFDDMLTGETDEDSRTIAGTGIGLPLGRIVEIYGPESSGKTTLTLHVISAMQRAGHLCAFVDAEHALDPKYASNVGVDLKTLLINQPDSAEQAIDVTSDLAASGKFACVVVDSVAALVPEAEVEGEAGDKHVALQARLMSQALRKLTPLVAKNNVLLVFVNQRRMKIGVRFGSPWTTSGGNALRFYASIRLDIQKVKTLKKSGEDVGIRSRIKAVKNKVAPPFREVHVDIFPNLGITTVYGDDADVGPREED